MLSMWEDMYDALRGDLQEVALHVPVHGITLYVGEHLASIDQHRATHYTKSVYTALVYLIGRWSRNDLWSFSIYARDGLYHQ